MPTTSLEAGCGTPGTCAIRGTGTHRSRNIPSAGSECFGATPALPSSVLTLREQHFPDVHPGDSDPRMKLPRNEGYLMDYSPCLRHGSQQDWAA